MSTSGEHHQVEVLRSESTAAAADSRCECKFCFLPKREPTVLQLAGASAVPSVGSLVEGWLLVVPTRHVYATAELTPSEWREFDAAVVQAKSLVEFEYGPVIVFEHGAAGQGKLAGCGVDHAHFHIVPSILDLRNAISRSDPELSQQLAWHPVFHRPRVSPNQDYLYINDHSGSWIAEHPCVPSQVIRKAIAQEIGDPEWNWRSSDRRNVMTDTLARLVVRS